MENGEGMACNESLV